jgi:hypothetical protein
MRVQFDRKPSKMLTLRRLKRRLPVAVYVTFFKNKPGIKALDF